MTTEPTVITSLQNERVKLIRSLEMRKARKDTGLFVAEGTSILVSAREQGFAPEMLVALAGASAESAIHRGLLAWGQKTNAQVLDVSEAVMGKLAAKDNPQTMMGVFRQRWSDAPAPSSLAPSDCWLALEEVRDPGNLGTILRTVEAVGARGVILVGACCDPTSRECVRATMGSIFAVPIVRMERPAFAKWIEGWPGDVVGTHLEGDGRFSRRAIQGTGIAGDGPRGAGLERRVDRSLQPAGRHSDGGARLDSLNLAVATALTLYQMRGRHLRM